MEIYLPETSGNSPGEITKKRKVPELQDIDQFPEIISETSVREVTGRDLKICPENIYSTNNDGPYEISTVHDYKASDRIDRTYSEKWDTTQENVEDAYDLKQKLGQAKARLHKELEERDRKEAAKARAKQKEERRQQRLQEKERIKYYKNLIAEEDAEDAEGVEYLSFSGK